VKAIQTLLGVAIGGSGLVFWIWGLWQLWFGWWFVGWLICGPFVVMGVILAVTSTLDRLLRTRA
jgi:hypothetical protein